MTPNGYPQGERYATPQGARPMNGRADLSLKTWSILISVFVGLFGVGSVIHSQLVVPSILREVEHIAEEEVRLHVAGGEHDEAVSHKELDALMEGMRETMRIQFHALEKQLDKIEKALAK